MHQALVAIDSIAIKIRSDQLFQQLCLLGVELFLGEDALGLEAGQLLQRGHDFAGPPAHRGRFVKIKYVTQLSTYYPAFAFICNNTKHVKDNYRNYLENQLRKSFNFTGAPISVFFRKK